MGEVVEHYNKEGTPNPYLDLKLDTLNLTEGEIDALVAFMGTLTDEKFLTDPKFSDPFAK